MPIYLGIRYYVWALIAWIAVAGTFGVILLYRVLISFKDRDELFVGEGEMRRAVEHVRHVDRMARLFGGASAVSLAAILAGWSLGWL
ncbi:MAG: hypothetical protein ACM336_12910 [Acidobacteriota bacterium]